MGFSVLSTWHCTKAEFPINRCAGPKCPHEKLQLWLRRDVITHLSSPNMDHE